MIALMEADTYLAKDVPLLRRMIAGDPLPDWHRAQVELGLTNRSYRRARARPAVPREGEPLAQRFTIEQRGRPRSSSRPSRVSDFDDLLRVWFG